MWTHGHFYWNELMTPDVEKAKNFYARTLGWTYEDITMPDETYSVIRDGGPTAIGSMMKMPAEVPSGTPPYWFAYIAVDDVDKRVAALEAEGGKIFKPAFDVPGVGRIAIVSDSTGAMMGWMTPAQQDD
ncbi:MAG: VOC family protein [Hyphomicrobiales bacterium]|nr:VOC family protein [Hyphomicrobiales bacterium]